VSDDCEEFDTLQENPDRLEYRVWKKQPSKIREVEKRDGERKRGSQKGVASSE